MGEHRINAAGSRIRAALSLVGANGRPIASTPPAPLERPPEALPCIEGVRVQSIRQAEGAPIIGSRLQIICRTEASGAGQVLQVDIAHGAHARDVAKTLSLLVDGLTAAADRHEKEQHGLEPHEGGDRSPEGAGGLDPETASPGGQNPEPDSGPKAAA